MENAQNEASKVTIEDMDKLMCDMFAQRAVCDSIEAQLTVENKKLAEMQIRATKYLEELGRDDYKSPDGTISFTERWTVTTPKTDLEKAQLFDWLKEQGLYDRYATVNSASLNALYNEQLEIAKSEGRAMEFTIPGVGLPKLFKQLRMRKAK